MTLPIVAKLRHDPWPADDGAREEAAATIERLSAELERRRAEMEYILQLTQRDDVSDGGKVIFVATKAREALTHAPPT